MQQANQNYRRAEMQVRVQHRVVPVLQLSDAVDMQQPCHGSRNAEVEDVEGRVVPQSDVLSRDVHVQLYSTCKVPSY
jgi:hypothetical protein